MEDQSNEELMRLFQAGETQAFELLVQRIERPLYFYILRLIGDEEQAKDILQEALLKVIRSVQRYDGKSKVKSWIYTISRNVCIDQLRKRKNRMISLDQPVGSESYTLLSMISDEGPDGLELSARQEIINRITEALDTISKDQREVFILREIQGYKFIEIAEILSCSENTVKSRMRYALQALRSELYEYRTLVQKSEESKNESA